MRIVMLGTGYVGIVSGTCFAEMGNTVTCVDTNEDKIEKLNRGIVPIYEPGLDQMIQDNTAKKRLFFTSDSAQAIQDAEIVFICVGTPPSKDGSADLSYVYESARTIGRNVSDYTVAVTKSTVPVGTTAEVERIIKQELSGRSTEAVVEMANNPEFLKEGNAITDFMGPDRVVVGTSSGQVRKIMRRIYAPFFRTDQRIIFMSIPSSELTKYASNSMLATRISFMNEVARLAESVGADIEEVRQGMARDKRIGKYFLYAGAGYGGSCFPKDVSALIKTGEQYGSDMTIIRAANDANNLQKRLVADKVLRFFNGDMEGKKCAIWGLAFKPETDDIREAPALDVIRILTTAGAECFVHDPEAMDNTCEILGKDNIHYCNDSYETLHDADVLIVMTEWKEYRTPDWVRIRSLMANAVVFDGRNLYFPDDMKELGFRYFGIGYGELMKNK